MPKIDESELEILGAYEKDGLASVATKSELAKLKAAARATAIKDRRVNIRLSSSDLSEARKTAEEWRRRLAGRMTSDSADLIREDQDR
jgi:predicted DNA binding CopG/RHH family protein